jgi:hypothetical protein
MNNEPVAWINRDEKEGWLNWDKNTNMPINIPLYPHPAKTLTDEEIEQEWVKSCPDKFHTNLIGFARAILRKAQEKC